MGILISYFTQHSLLCPDICIHLFCPCWSLRDCPEKWAIIITKSWKTHQVAEQADSERRSLTEAEISLTLASACSSASLLPHRNKHSIERKWNTKYSMISKNKYKAKWRENRGAEWQGKDRWWDRKVVVFLLSICPFHVLIDTNSYQMQLFSDFFETTSYTLLSFYANDLM